MAAVRSAGAPERSAPFLSHGGPGRSPPSFTGHDAVRGWGGRLKRLDGATSSARPSWTSVHPRRRRPPKRGDRPTGSGQNPGARNVLPASLVFLCKTVVRREAGWISALGLATMAVLFVPVLSLPAGGRASADDHRILAAILPLNEHNNLMTPSRGGQDSQPVPGAWRSVPSGHREAPPAPSHDPRRGSSRLTPTQRRSGSRSVGRRATGRGVGGPPGLLDRVLLRRHGLER